MKVRDNINRWREISCSWVGRIKIVKMTILSNAIYRFNTIPIKLPMAFFFPQNYNKKFHISYGNIKDSKKSKQSWERRMELEKSTFLTSVYTTKLQPSSSMLLVQKQKYRPMQQDREPWDKPTQLWVPYFWRRRQEYRRRGKDSLFNNRCWENWTTTCKRMITT